MPCPVLPCTGDCFTAVSGGDEEERSIRKSKHQRQTGVIYGQRGVLQIAAVRVEWTVGREGAWEEAVRFILHGSWKYNEQQPSANIHTFLFVKTSLKYVWHELWSTWQVVHSSDGRWFKIFHILWNVTITPQPLEHYDHHNFSNPTEQKLNSRQSSQKQYKGSNLVALSWDTQVWGCNFSRTWDIQTVLFDSHLHTPHCWKGSHPRMRTSLSVCYQGKWHIGQENRCLSPMTPHRGRKHDRCGS